MNFTGRLIEEQKNYFVVNTEAGDVRAVLKGVLKKERLRALVGDIVDLELTNSDTLEGIIIKIHNRESSLKRPSISNITQIAFITSYNQPPIDLEALDRYLFSAEAYELHSIIVFNKMDILDSKELSELRKLASIYTNAGYEVLFTSAISGEGLDKLIERCRNELTAFAGLSGVGKSSLLQKIFPVMEFRIGNLSGATGRGSHTTTNAVLLMLDKNSFIADTPGHSFVDIPVLPKDSVCACFPEIAKQTGNCRFNNCLHDGEPGCAVQALIDKGEIAGFRREHFLKIYQEIKNLRKKNY
jgi:ribosome biogenesis GTPase